MKIFLTKIVGTLIYVGSGGYDISYHNYVERFDEMILDGEPFSSDHVTLLPDGNLCVYGSSGDEQPSSDLYIYKDWKIELVEQEIKELSYDTFNSYFKEIRTKGYGNYRSGIPAPLRQIFKNKTESNEPEEE